MTQVISSSELLPIGEINTTPLIDVMLVLLVMLIITIPAATHSLEVPLPQGADPFHTIRPINTVAIDSGNRILWNGATVSPSELTALLGASARLPAEPELRFQPEGSASYGLSAEVLRLIKNSGVTAFGFVGNEHHSEFSAQD